jgi:very-short-patch-repair endonuclease
MGSNSKKHIGGHIMADQNEGDILQSKARATPKDVINFLTRSSFAYGDYHADGFTQRILRSFNCSDGCESPIEQLFEIALALQIEVLYHIHLIEDSNSFYWETQAGIGKYRVDFLLTYKEGMKEHKLIVELDGHDFHEKDKKQRSYEKARDRFFIKSGYKVIHFTGSDVVADPHQVVFESLSVLGVHGYDSSCIDAIDPNDILQRHGRGRTWLERVI